MNRMQLTALLAATAMTALAGAANAGGFSRGNADTDIIYEDGNFNMRAGVTFVSPEREITESPNAAALVGTSYTPDYVLPSAAIKMGITENLVCAGTLAQPYGGHVDYAVANRVDNPTPTPVGLPNYGKQFEQFDVHESALTCGVKFQVGPGNLYVLGGGFIETFSYNRNNWLAPDGSVVANLTLEGEDTGYRVGIGYQITEIALRAQLMYRSGTSYGAEGTLTFGPAAFPAIGLGELPQSLELSLQSGIAEGWLALFNVKWMDWSVTEQLIVEATSGSTLLVRDENNYFWSDGWTISAGIGHKFNETVTGLVGVQWDKGVGTGYDLSSDTWGLRAGMAVKDSIGGELRFGGGVTYITSARETLDRDAAGNPVATPGFAVDDGWAYALSAGYSVKW